MFSRGVSVNVRCQHGRYQCKAESRGLKKRRGPEQCCGVRQVNYWPSTVEHTDEVEWDLTLPYPT